MVTTTTPLREQMRRALRIRNVSPRTEYIYIHMVAGFAAHFGRSTDRLTECSLPRTRDLTRRRGERIGCGMGQTLMFHPHIHRVVPGENVTFSWRDCADNNPRKDMSLDAVELLRRFLRHVLPPRFTRVRYYGVLANRHRAINVAKARELIGSKRPLRPRTPIPNPRLCPQCRKGTMRRMAPVDPQCDRTWFDTS